MTLYLISTKPTGKKKYSVSGCIYTETELLEWAADVYHNQANLTVERIGDLLREADCLLWQFVGEGEGILPYRGKYVRLNTGEEE